ncbi:MAG: hypothetical protein ACREDL_09985 [Bradyrhizobium sp.]
MQRVAIERAGADRPALLDAHAGAGGRSLLLGAQGSMPGNRHDVRDRRAVAGDQFLAGLNLADAPRKAWLASRSVRVLLTFCGSTRSPSKCSAQAFCLEAPGCISFPSSAFYPVRVRCDGVSSVQQSKSRQGIDEHSPASVRLVAYDA